MSSEDSDEQDVRIITSSHDLDDYDILSTRLISVAVPHRTNEEFRKMIWGAMVTYSAGNSSVDNVLRRWKGYWENRSDKSFQTDQRIISLREICDIVADLADKLEKVQVASLGEVCAKSALCRLEASFKAAYGLVRRYYVFETEAVVRMILEQLAWTYVVRETPEEKIAKLKPNDCITPFKSFFPECGRMYGPLSNGAHIDPSIAKHYAAFHNEGVPAVRRSRLDSFDSGQHIVELAPIYLKLVQDTFRALDAEAYEQLRDRLRSLRDAYLAAQQSDAVEE